METINVRHGDELLKLTPRQWGRAVLKLLDRREKLRTSMKEVQSALHAHLGDDNSRVYEIKHMLWSPYTKTQPLTHEARMAYAYIERLPEFAKLARGATHAWEERDFRAFVEGMLM